MCGIALVLGPGDASGVFAAMLAALAPRGERLEVSERPGLLAGTQRLAIVDRDRAVQPWTDGRYLLCYNGELYNYPAVAAELSVAGCPGGDTAVLLAAFARWGEQAVRRFRGEFAFAVAEPGADRVYVARDPLGVKPLYWARSDGRLHLASEIKALVALGVPVHEVPPGHHGWVTASGGPVLSRYVDVGVPDHDELVEDPAEAAKLVRAAFEDSVRVRVDTDLPVGVIVSGGLDSSLALLHVREMHADCVAFTVGAPGSEDLHYARRLCADLGVPHEVVELSPGQIGLSAIRTAIAISELTEYGDIINAVVSVPLFRRVRQAGVKVVLTGDGSDELFGGYAMYDDMYGQAEAGGRQAERLFRHKLATLGRTELQRVDRASMAATVEARVPFLDPALVEVAMRLPMSLKVRDGQEKWILREAFADLLPGYIRQRPKNPMSHSSGLHERARLYKPLFARIHRSLGYDRCAPVRRDFSTVLEACGMDLSQALARADADYTALEQVRDLAGAVRWNLAAAAGRGRDLETV